MEKGLSEFERARQQYEKDKKLIEAANDLEKEVETLRSNNPHVLKKVIADHSPKDFYQKETDPINPETSH